MAYELYRFDQYCIDKELSTPLITKELISEWIVQKPTEGAKSQKRRIGAVRILSEYMNILSIPCYIPGECGARVSKSTPYILSKMEIKDFFKQVDDYEPRKPKNHCSCYWRMGLEYRVIFRVIFPLGLRISEACDLLWEYVDLEKGIIDIMHSKGDKDRRLFIPDDMKFLLKDYKRLMETEYNTKSTWVFPAAKDITHHVQKTMIEKKFNLFWNATEFAVPGGKKPTVHSLRHTMVVMRINTWLKDGVDFENMMPYLVAWLGHSGRQETYYYFKTIVDTLTVMRDRGRLSSTVIPKVRKDKEDS